MRRTMSVLLSLCLVLCLPLTAQASKMGELEEYGVSLIQYYRHHQEAAEDVIWDLVEKMKKTDPRQGAAWEKIMADWSWINSEMPIYENNLPDGLPQDNSLCIVVMGFGLNDDGSMRQELVDRLVVALSAALKYPNAYVLVTGGQTGQVDGVTEAGQMASWLRNKGLDSSRILQENQSLSTTANAVNVYKLLTRSYPQVSSIAVVTSDYHITASCALFAAVSNYQSGYNGTKQLELVGNAVCDTGNVNDSIDTQAWGMSLIMDLPYEEKARAPKLYYVDRPEPVLTEPVSTNEHQPGWPELGEFVPGEEPEEGTQQAPEEKASFPVLPVAAAAAVGITLWIFTPRKPKKSARREKPKMNWEE